MNCDKCERCGREITESVGYAETENGFICEDCCDAIGRELDIAP